MFLITPQCEQGYKKRKVLARSMERKIEKKDNFISIDAAEGEEVQIKTGSDTPLVFIMPYDGKINLYIKREHIPIQFK